MLQPATLFQETLSRPQPRTPRAIPHRLRHAISRIVAMILAASLVALAGCGQEQKDEAEEKQETSQKALDTVPMEDLLRPGELKELVLGPEDAKVTIVEYASMTCGHCATFHNKVFPDLKQKYIDTNKVRFILREFPLNNLAAAASMLARCASEEKTYPLVEALFKTQRDWAFTRDNPLPKLFDVAKQAGFTKTTFDECLKNEKLLKSITDVRERGSKVFGVNSTPTFFINGKRLKGGRSLEEFDKVIEPLLTAG